MVLLWKTGDPSPPRKVPATVTTGIESFILRGNLMKANVVREIFLLILVRNKHSI